MKAFRYQTIIGPIYLVETDQKLSHLFFDELPLVCKLVETPLLKKASLELKEYLAGNRMTFTVPLYFKGTIFQEKVWNALLTIPYGKTLSYQEVGSRIDSPKAYRAIGNANHKNPLPIFIPCHRIIRKNGELGGYGGGEMRKTFLLSLEQK